MHALSLALSLSNGQYPPTVTYGHGFCSQTSEIIKALTKSVSPKSQCQEEEVERIRIAHPSIRPPAHPPAHEVGSTAQ